MEKKEQELAVVLNNAKQKLVDTINELNINPCIMQYIVRDIYEVVCRAAEQEYMNAIQNDSEE